MGALWPIMVNMIDIALLLLVGLSIFGGYRRGFILGAFDLLSWVLSLLAGLRFYQTVAGWLAALTPALPRVWSRPIAFIAIVILVGVVIQILGHVLFRRLPRKINENAINRWLGTIPGLANGLISAAIVASLLLALPLNEGLLERARASSLANRLAGYTEILESALHPVFGEAIAETLNLLTVEPESNERVTLPFKVAEPAPRPDLEAKMLELVNAESVLSVFICGGLIWLRRAKAPWLLRSADALQAGEFWTHSSNRSFLDPHR